MSTNPPPASDATPTPGAGGVDATLYAIRDTERLGEHYTRHVAAMTAEGLHAKSAIAAELAYRDAEIERLRPYEPMLIPSDFPREMAVKCARGFLARIVQSFDALNGESNYSVTEVQTANGRKYEVTVRRTDKPTPHVLRKKAEAERDALRAAVEELRARKDGAYEERNRVVALLAAVAYAPPLMPWSACRSRTAIEGWSDDWHGCVYIETPVGQLSWHYHDSHAGLFAHLPFIDRHPWDGHTTEEKYARIEKLTGAALARGPAAGETTDGGGKD